MKTHDSDALYRIVERKLIDYMKTEPVAKLPTEADLAQRFGVSRTTLTKALDALKQKGYIKKRRGHGNFVLRSVLNENMSLNDRADFSRLIEQAGYRPTLIREILQYEYPTRAVRERLGLSLEEFVLSIRYRFFADDQPAIHTVQYIPKKLIARTPGDDSATGEDIEEWDFFRRFTDQVFSHVIFEFVPVQAPDIAQSFGLDPSVCLQMLRQRSFNIYDQAIACSESHMNPHIMNLSLSSNV